MCGIIFLLAKKTTPELIKLVETQGKVITHRGPDESGIYHDKNIILVHKRLSIIDLEKGHQPLYSEKKDIILVCNGEIYNHKDLHSKLKTKHTFATSSDSEVIIHLYEDYGPEMLNMLDGDFGFILIDKREKNETKFLFGRDKIGIKPLFLGYDKDDQLWISSELKAFPNLTEFKSLEDFPPGHYIYATEKTNFKKDLKKYYFPNWEDFRISNTKSDLKGIRESFENAVKKRLMSDVPVGGFLSGGLDSSLVCAVAKKFLGKNDFHTFSVGVKTKVVSDDVKYAREVSKFIKSVHHERLFTVQEGFDVIEKVIYHLESYDPSPIRSGCAYFLLCENVKKYCKVALTGEGADEVMAGYLYFTDAKSKEELHVETITKVKNLYGVQLKFHDRLAMAHSIEVRVPFLDVDFLQVGFGFDPEEKMLYEKDTKKRRTEKFVLRKAFEGYLPDEVLWRQKEQFGDGVGYIWIDTLKEIINQKVSDEELKDAKKTFPHDTPTTKEQFYYRKVFEKFYPGKLASKTVKRWFPWSKNDNNVDSSARSYAQKYHNNPLKN